MEERWRLEQKPAETMRVVAKAEKRVTYCLHVCCMHLASFFTKQTQAIPTGTFSVSAI